jgi:hypothetical protein
MARLTRKNIKVFAGDARNNGVFGSLQANNPVLTNDVEQLQSLSAWGEGWNAATETSEDLPPLEEIQGVEYVTTYQQAYIMQEGLPEWAETVTYYKGCLAKEVTSTGFRIYNSLTDDNTGNLLSDTSNWKKVMDSEDLYAFDNAVVHKAGSETISGEKTFSVSPIVPTATAGDNSTKAANTEFVTTVASSLQTQINQKANTTDVVHLSGNETITGWKTFKNDIFLGGVAGSGQEGGQINFNAGESEINQNVFNFDRKDGEFRFFGVGLDGNVHVPFRININNNLVYANPSDVSNTVVTTINKSKSENGYFKLGNGLIIQWGHAAGGGATVTLPTPFTSTNYQVALTQSENSEHNVNPTVSRKTTTNFYAGNHSWPIDWIAIGY